MKKLSPDTVEALASLRDATGVFESALGRALEALQNDIATADEWAGERSDKWNEGDTGQAHEEWRTNLGALRDVIDTTMDAVDELQPEIADVQARMPEIVA